MVASFVLSLTDFDPREPDEITVHRPRQLHADAERPDRRLHSLLVTVRFALIVVPLTMGVRASGIALLVNNTLLAGRNVFRTLFYMPVQIPLVASTLVWLGVLQRHDRLAQPGPRRVGMPGPTGSTARPGSDPALALMGLWGIGNMMLIFLAGLQGVPTELYDAAKVDGAGPWAQLPPRHAAADVAGALLQPDHRADRHVPVLHPGVRRSATAAATPTTRRSSSTSTCTARASSSSTWATRRRSPGLLFVIVLGLTSCCSGRRGRWVYEGGER